MSLPNLNCEQEYYNNYSNNDSFNQMNYFLKESKSKRESILKNKNQFIKHSKHISFKDAKQYSVIHLILMKKLLIQIMII